MKTTQPFYKIIASVLLVFSMTWAAAQNNNARPEFLSVTTMHWNMDNESFDMDEWKKVEKEYLEKVTMKNEYVMSASFYLHFFTEDNSELMYVQSYPNWEAMGKAAARNEELAKAAWPDDKARMAFLKKREAYYSHEHSDEIYATLPNAKPLPANNTEDLLLYVRRSHFAFPEDGTQEEFNTLHAQDVKNVINKNEYIKGYYPAVHAWGSDRTEVVEAFFVTSLADLDMMLKKLPELYEAAWPDKAEREAWGKKMGKYFTPVHGDSIYTLVAELSK
ncbi:hypothetical protein [Altibacter lentus]|uniref:hypothetical protein n=1 Tax=Altibacter lentus TaxID=1223410 RepID=UPI00126914A7|nr:hypothetical protein [Altibacter lentus]